MVMMMNQTMIMIIFMNVMLRGLQRLKRTSSTLMLTSFSFDNWRDDVTRKLDTIIAKVSSIEDYLKSSYQIATDSCSGGIVSPPNKKKMRLGMEDDQREPCESSASVTPSMGQSLARKIN